MRILLAEDEKDLSRAIATVLRIKEKYDVDQAYDGVEAVRLARENAYDAMVFDIMMPRKDGIEALKDIRKTGDNTPVILLTAKSELEDRVVGLDAGADDYLAKPFAMEELLARLRAMMRRASNYTPKKLSLGNISLDVEAEEMKAVNSISVNKKEARMMELFMTNPEKSITTEEFLNHIWSDEEDVEDGVVWIYISYLKNKLEAISADYTIRGEMGSDFTFTKILKA